MHVVAGMQRAASGGQPWAALLGGDALRHQEYDNTDPSEAQERILERLECAYSRARSLAVYHVQLADLFATEAEELKELLRASEASL